MLGIVAWMLFGDLASRLRNGRYLLACYGGLYGILAGLTKSTDHPSSRSKRDRPLPRDRVESSLHEARQRKFRVGQKGLLGFLEALVHRVLGSSCSSASCTSKRLTKSTNGCA